MGKKILSMLLCVGLCMGMLAGCGGKDDKTSSKDNDKTGSSDVEADADYMSGDPVELKLVIYGDNNDANQKFIDEKLRPRLIEELNIDLDLEFMSWGAADQVRTMAMSGEAFGFMFDPNANPWQADGIMATIAYEDIERLAPDYLDARGINGFDWCKDVEGNIICFPLRSMPNPDLDGVAVRNDILNKVGLDYTDIKNYDDFMEATLKVKEEFPDLWCNPSGTVERKECGIPDDVLLSGVGPLYIAGPGMNGGLSLAVFDENNPEKIISIVETDWLKEYYRIQEEYIELGLKSNDPLVNKGYDDAWNTGNALYNTAYTQMVYRYDELSGVEGSDVKVIRFDGYQDILKLDYNWTIAVSIEDQNNVEHWIRLINWMYESKENNYFISKGEEGVDWEYAEDGVAINDLSDVSLVHDWMIATDKFEEVSTEKYGEEPVAEYWALNENAVQSKAMGFIFDSTPVETEVALLSTIVTEELELYAGGYKSVDDGYDEMVQKMKDAGLDKYIEEVQKQWTEFLANK